MSKLLAIESTSFCSELPLLLHSNLSHIWSGKCCRLSKEFPTKFQILTVVSLDVVATTKGLSGCMLMPYTSEWWQFITWMHVMLTVSQSLTVASQEELRRSHGAFLCQSRPRTREECPLSTPEEDLIPDISPPLLFARFQILTVPSSLPVATISLILLFQTTLKTFALWPLNWFTFLTLKLPEGTSSSMWLENGFLVFGSTKVQR